MDMRTAHRAARAVMSRALAKAAGLASGLGAILLGAGLALLAPDALRAQAVPILIVGAAVHGVGMTVQHRLESQDRPAAAWERALFWACWIGLGGLAAWLGARLLAS
ncbi:hypothetical protein [Ramlibacter sp.]|uniref:hypothetical protein n=1 Tax=Ramlibacter sp. TaxID=1917967 RepID=UPI002FC59121